MATSCCCCRVSVLIVYSVNDFSFLLLSTPAPATYPSQFQCIAFESEYITLVWGEVHIPGQNGPILGYHVRRHGSTPTPSVYVIEGGEIRQLRVVVALYPGKKFAFSIAAYNEAGVGLFSPVVYAPDPAP